MTDSHDRHDSSFYRSLVSLLTDTFPWTFVDDGRTPAESFARAADGSSSIGELRLSHLYTDAELYLSMPNYRDGGALRAVMYHPLDHRLEPEDDGFIGNLARSHEQIATGYQCHYLEPAADPTVVLRASIPLDYSPRRVTEMMTAITTIALRVQRLHRDIQAPIADVLSEEPSRRAGPSPQGSPP
ncbi:hypothetical protein [Haloarcula amylolytica]|uniref:hypothetical protein n=1 Tax=Haloarcula amylolytica TaxID=396317 RepID=UPI003C784476